MDLVLDRVAADQFQGLHQVRIAVALAGAGQRPRRTPESREKHVLVLAVGQLGS